MGDKKKIILNSLDYADSPVLHFSVCDEQNPVSSQKVMAAFEKVVRASRPDAGRDGLPTFSYFALP